MGFVYWFGYNASKLFAHLWLSYRASGRERIIEEGPAILAMNHQSFLDPPMAGIACRKPIYYLARKSLLRWPILGPLFPRMNVIPVDQDKADMSALKTVIRLLREGKRVLIFPEGERSVDGNLQPFQAGLGLVIAKTGAPVVPMRIFGAHEAFPRGGKGIRRHPVTVMVGEPIRFDLADFKGESRAVYQRLGDRVYAAIAALENPRASHSLNRRSRCI